MELKSNKRCTNVSYSNVLNEIFDSGRQNKFVQRVYMKISKRKLRVHYEINTYIF